MKSSIKNIFGVAAAMIVILGFNVATDITTIELPFVETKIETAEEKQITSLKDFNDSIVDIAQKTNPAVVTINTEKTQEIQTIDPFSFFGNPWGGGTQPEIRERTQRGLGSGVIVSEDGYILTNNHVIEGVDEIKIRLFNDDEIDATLIGADPQTDIAVLKIDGKNLPALAIGDSDESKVGAFVLAIGSPLSEDLAHTVSFGIVSARGRNIKIIRNSRGDFYGYEDFIQTDAAINPGNSGGALIDMDGKLIGINSAIASRSGGNDGIGFAIPINLAKRIMDDLIDDGKVSRGYLGIEFGGEVDRTMAMALGLDQIRGIIIGQVIVNGPSYLAGLRKDDIVVSIKDQPVRKWNAFRTKIASLKPGDKVKLGIIRGDTEQNITVELGELPTQLNTDNKVLKQDLDEQIGFTPSNLTDDLKTQLNVGNEIEGIVVKDVEQSSNAFERGLRNNDIITSVKRKNIQNVSEFYKEIEEAIESNDKAVLFEVERENMRLLIAFEL